jgi:hypothetical protein
MNTTVKVLIGAGIGAGIGYFIGTVIVEVIHLREEEYYGIKPDVILEDEVKDNRKVLTRNRRKLDTKDYTKHYSTEGQPELAALVAKYNGDRQEEVEEISDSSNEEEEFDIPEDEKKETDPSIISVSEFANAGDEFDCLTLHFYDDDVVTDEHGNPIDRPEQILGSDALISFGMLSEDEDVVYVRNLAKKAMYEVVRLNKDYSAPEPRRRRVKEEKDDNGEDNP